MVTTPATTVSGAAADRTKKTTEGTPRRPRANASETLLGRCDVTVEDMGAPV
uniref:Uncharacterized protein n=1 Tax=Verrucosispora sp. MS100047 TaxID=1410949 RepID=A0A097CSQ0_9ACTN|nr:hypothetical protein VASRM7_448 [Verrucosispora sp. MS100047]